MKKGTGIFCLILLLVIYQNPVCAQVKDVDGKNYRTTILGTQTWTAENLEVSHFRNGDPIPEVRSAEEWKEFSLEEKPAWCYYNNDPVNGKKYGRLYNYYAATDGRGIAPKGWHVPNESDWTKLINYLGGVDIAGAKMKSKSGWGKNAVDAKELGFAGLPGGYRYHFGSAKIDFENIGSFGNWWSATAYDNSEDAIIYSLSTSSNGVYQFNDGKGMANAIRLVKD